jgi:phage baseplate assembly protein W
MTGHSTTDFTTDFTVDFPLGADNRGRTARSDNPTHIRHLIESVLFTSPGERVNRPTFGSGLLQMVFEPAGEVVAAAVAATVQGNLHEWVGELIEVQRVEVTSVDSTLSVTVAYVVRRTGESRLDLFERTV